MAKKTQGISAVVGFVDMDKEGYLYNAAAIISNGELKGIYRKTALPNYGVFDDKRYFKEGKGNELYDFEGNLLKEKLFDINGLEVGVHVCEDVWVNEQDRKILEERQKIEYYEDEEGNEFRLNPESGCWERAYGMSWETCHSQEEEELTKARKELEEAPQE